MTAAPPTPDDRLPQAPVLKADGGSLTPSLGLRRGVLLSLVVVFTLMDRLTKVWVLRSMAFGESIPVIDGVFHLTHVHNTGVAFSLFKEHPQALTVMACLFFGGFLAYALLQSRLDGMLILILSLILGGAAGNIWDRLTLGKVVDYFDFTLIHYPVFNLADSFIFVGVALLLYRTLKAPNPETTCPDITPPDATAHEGMGPEQPL